jgi:hypothetical protein
MINKTINQYAIGNENDYQGEMVIIVVTLI